jgi:hypothetical protein
MTFQGGTLTPHSGRAGRFPSPAERERGHAQRAWAAG